MSEEKNFNEEVEETAETEAVYTITIEDTENGSVLASSTAAAENEEVFLTITPDLNYALDTLSVKGVSNYDEVSVIDNKFIMPAYDVVVTASFVEKETVLGTDEQQETVEIIEDDASVQDEKKPVSPKAIIIAVAVLVVAAIIVLGIIFGPRMFNKYNKEGYVDVSGRTIAEVAETAGMSLEDFLAEYELPSDMPGNTSESAAYYTIPVSRMAQMYGMDFETLQSTLDLPDTITEDSTWGEAEGEARLGLYVGEDNLESFKETYGLGDEVTSDTLWKEVRNIVDEYARQQNIESQQAQESAADESVTSDTEVVTDTAEDAATDTAADETAAE
ncbi:MAG: hypothetical protein LIO59_05455 [Oscillospiraceae bacterium]|nr:hypothetical protein [Oscillospiraceae bacterium]